MRQLLSLALTAGIVAFAAPEALADHKGKVPWLEPTEGFQQARMTGKPIMLFFTADW